MTTVGNEESTEAGADIAEQETDAETRVATATTCKGDANCKWNSNKAAYSIKAWKDNQRAI